MLKTCPFATTMYTISGIDFYNTVLRKDIVQEVHRQIDSSPLALLRDPTKSRIESSELSRRVHPTPKHTWG